MRKNQLSTLSLTILLLGQLPLGALAAGPCALSALDTVAGLGTQVTLSGCTGVGTTPLALRGQSGTTYTQQITVDASGNAMTLIPSKYTLSAGRYEVTTASTSATFTVIADRADDRHSTFVASPTAIRGNGRDSVTVTAVLRDKYDNPVTGRPVTLISSRTSDEVSALSAQTDESGRMLWTVRATQSGPMTLIPYDIISGRQLSLRSDVSVTGGSMAYASPIKASLTSFGGNDTSAELTSSVVDHLELSLPQNVTNVKANELFGMNIRAMNGTSLVRGYVGTLIVESSDIDAELPKKGEDPKTPDTGRIDMRSVDQGERKLSLIFVLRKPGKQTITVYDKLDPLIKGTITLNVTRDGSPESETITIKDPLDRAHIQGTTVKLQGKAPSLVNLKVKGGKSVVDTETDAEGVFRVDVPLNPDDKEVTLFVTSENGTMESEPVHLIIDNEPPIISTVSLDPEAGKTESPATITVKSEAGLTSVVADINGTTLTLTGTGMVYTGTLTAPKDPGSYDIKVTATDSVGNASTMLMKWNVKPREMPRVVGVKAESQPQQVSLSWHEIETAAVAEYRIYIANKKDPNNYLYSLSTKQAVTSAVVKDLPLGETYQFSLTAVNPDGTESNEKSEPVSATPLGMHFTATSGPDSLLLEWTTLQDLPLDHYILEYGTQPGEYSEKRTINGEARSFMLRDLINDVTYELKLTPITVTGKTMTDLSAVTRGTPGGSGFAPGTEDPVPPDIDGTLHPGANLYPPPSIPDVSSTPRSGIPSMAGVVLVIVSLLGGYFGRKSIMQRRLTHEFLSAMQERYHS